jgi:hypothetical protein
MTAFIQLYLVPRLGTPDILTEFVISMKLAKLIKMCINETCSKVQRGKHLSDTFPIQICLKKGDPNYCRFSTLP